MVFIFFYLFKILPDKKVNILQRENILQKETLEKEIAFRQTLQLQLESKNQFIHSFTSPSPQSHRKSNNSINTSCRESKQKTGKTNVIYFAFKK